MPYNSFKARELVKADIANKKPFGANNDFTCYTCGIKYLRDNEFFFVGGKMVCPNCLGEMQELL